MYLLDADVVEFRQVVVVDEDSRVKTADSSTGVRGTFVGRGRVKPRLAQRTLRGPRAPGKHIMSNTLRT